MKQAKVGFKSEFQVVLGNARSQAAEMVLSPGKSEGGPSNKHRGSDQWLLILSGSGVAVVNGKSHRLSKSSLLLIEHGETHEIRNTGTTPLKTLTLYVPPAYTESGEELPTGKP